MRRMTGEHATPELMAFTGRSNRSKFREQVLNPLLALGLVETTIPDKPTSSKQRYRLTAAGRALQLEQGTAQD
ncbi:Fic family protein [Stutzerimonas balearica]|uniref:Fic family protein n=1 Tax=Stutzerimonas balearica TaxID=74829 RepID=UPI00384AAA04